VKFFQWLPRYMIFYDLADTLSLIELIMYQRMAESYA
jgi:hypothetical protein